MNADRARPLAAYIVISLVCAAVMIEGLRANSLGEVLGVSPETPAASPSSSTTEVVPGSVLRARGDLTGAAIPAGLPPLPSPAVSGTAATAGNTAVGSQDTTPGTSSKGSGGGGTPSRPGGPGPDPAPDRPDGPTTSAGGVALDPPGKSPGKKDGKKGPRKPRKPQAPAAEATSTPDGPGKGTGKGPGRD